MKDKNFCRCCKGRKLLRYLDLGLQPLANGYHKGEKLEAYPLEVALCLNCFHSQLSIVINPRTMFKNYLYVSGTTDTFRKHCEDLAKDAIKRIKKEKISVLDIACNDGTQLEYFRRLGCEVLGVDPAKNLRHITLEKNIPVVVDYWNTKLAKKMNGRFDLITGTNVFAHVDDLDEFLKACKVALSPDGILILEFPYADKMVSHNEFDTVYHEHLSYFLVNSFKTLVDRLGFSIVDVLQTPIHGGSIRFFLSRKKNSGSKKVQQLITQEQERGLLQLETYRQFAERIKSNKKDFKAFLKIMKQEKRKVVGYGASAKGNTMLNYFKVNLDYIVDDNSLKWGYYTPGRDVSIVSPETLSKDPESLAIVVLSWNFFEEIKRKVTSLRINRQDDIFVLYVPDVRTDHVSSLKKT